MAPVDGLPSVAPPLPLFALSTVSLFPNCCAFLMYDHQTLLDIRTSVLAARKADAEHFSGKPLRLAN